MGHENELVETGVDELLKLVKRKGKVSVADAAHLLKIHEGIIQNWVDFHVRIRIRCS